MKEMVHHPEHYNKGIEAILFIEAWGLNFSKGSVLKYVVRSGIKDPEKEIEDLRKAIQYTEFEIDRFTRQRRLLYRHGEISIREFTLSWELNQNRVNIITLLTGWTMVDTLKEIIVLLNKEIIKLKK